MRTLVLAASLVAFSATPALAGFGLGVGITEPTAAPGENFEINVTVQNRSPGARRMTLRMRLRGHNRVDSKARRFRSTVRRTRLLLEAGEERVLRLGVPVPPEAAGAVKIEVRGRSQRRTVEGWVTSERLFPSSVSATRVPYQPLFRLSMVRELDADHSPRNLVIRDRVSFDALLDSLRVQTPEAWGRETDFRDRGAYARPVDVDFAQETVLAIVTGGREHYDFVRISEIRSTSNSGTVCRYEIVPHRRNAGAFADHVWAPVIFLTIPRSDAPVRFQERRARR